jgi:hypothetical protein
LNQISDPDTKHQVASIIEEYYNNKENETVQNDQHKECYLIGFSSANKKSIAEQAASNIALVQLQVDAHF